jgi:hypothetical protein
VRASMARTTPAPAVSAQQGRPAAATVAVAAGAAVPAADKALPLVPENWSAIIEALGLSGFARQLAANCALAGRQGSQVKLLLDPRATRTASNENRIAEALSRYLGETVKLVFEAPAAEAPATPARELRRQDEARLAQARAALESDPNIQALQQRMGATIFPDSVRATTTEEN